MRLSTRAWHLILISLLIFALWFILRTIEPGFFLSDDNGNYFLGTYAYTYQSVVRDHTLPVINYHQLLGNPHLGQGQSSVFYPPLYLAFFLSYLLTNSPLLGIDLLVLFHFILAATGIYLLLTSLKTNPHLCFLASLLYISFPFVIGVSRIWIVVPYLLAYLPWNWWALHRFLRQPNKSNQLLLITIKLLLILQGYVQWVLLSALLELIYLAAILWQQHHFLNSENPKINRAIKDSSLWGKGRSGGVSFHQIPLFKWFASPWLLPYLPIWPITALLGSPVLLPLWHTAGRSDVRSVPLTTADFMRITVTLTDWFQAQIFQYRSGIIFDGTTFIYHLGILLVLVFCYLLYRFRHQLAHDRLWFPWIAITIFSFVICTDLYILAYHLPPLNWFRWPFKHLLPFEFFFTVALALGLNQLINQRVGIPSSLKSRDQGGARRREYPGIDGLVGISNLFSYAILILAILTNLYVVYQNRGAATAFSTDRVNTPTPTWTSLTPPLSGRILSFGVDLNQSHIQRSLGAYNFATLDNYISIGGYDATVSTPVWLAIQGLPEFGATQSTVSQDSIKSMRTWGVRYWITDNPTAAATFATDHPDLPELYHQANITIFQDSQALPLVYWSDGTPADFAFHPDGITVKPNNHSGPLLFNVIAWPEYLASVDGHTISITVINNRPTITVSPGASSVKLTYIDHQLRLGLLISALTLVGLIIFFNHSNILKNLRISHLPTS